MIVTRLREVEFTTLEINGNKVTFRMDEPTGLQRLALKLAGFTVIGTKKKNAFVEEEVSDINFEMERVLDESEAEHDFLTVMARKADEVYGPK